MSQVKVEEEDQQVFCIKEEPEEAPEVISCLLLDNQLNRGHLAQSEVTFLTWIFLDKSPELAIYLQLQYTVLQYWEQVTAAIHQI